MEMLLEKLTELASVSFLLAAVNDEFSYSIEVSKWGMLVVQLD